MTVIFGRKGEDGRLLARPLLEEAVRLTWGWAELPAITRSSGGKPGFSCVQGRWFSLSHSGGYALCALSDDGPVGVDIERTRPRQEKLMKYALSPAEGEGCTGWGDFYRIWTLKESWCKREDIPLYPPRRLETPPPCPHRSFSGEDWSAAVCTVGQPPEQIHWI